VRAQARGEAGGEAFFLSLSGGKKREKTRKSRLRSEEKAVVFLGKALEKTLLHSSGKGDKGPGRGRLSTWLFGGGREGTSLPYLYPKERVSLPLRGAKEIDRRES